MMTSELALSMIWRYMRVGGNQIHQGRDDGTLLQREDDVTRGAVDAV